MDRIHHFRDGLAVHLKVACDSFDREVEKSEKAADPGAKNRDQNESRNGRGHPAPAESLNAGIDECEEHECGCRPYEKKGGIAKRIAQGRRSQDPKRPVEAMRAAGRKERGLLESVGNGIATMWDPVRGSIFHGESPARADELALLLIAASLAFLSSGHGTFLLDLSA